MSAFIRNVFTSSQLTASMAFSTISRMWSASFPTSVPACAQSMFENIELNEVSIAFPSAFQSKSSTNP